MFFPQFTERTRHLFLSFTLKLLSFSRSLLALFKVPAVDDAVRRISQQGKVRLERALDRSIDDSQQCTNRLSDFNTFLSKKATSRCLLILSQLRATSSVVTAAAAAPAAVAVGVAGPVVPVPVIPVAKVVLSVSVPSVAVAAAAAVMVRRLMMVVTVVVRAIPAAAATAAATAGLVALIVAASATASIVRRASPKTSAAVPTRGRGPVGALTRLPRWGRVVGQCWRWRGPGKIRRRRVRGGRSGCARG